jgi:glycosyltransferase involved in cell wall biosynthesis
MITNFQKYLYDRLPYLHTRLDLANPAHVRELIEWYVIHSASEWRLDLQLVEPAAARIGLYRRPRMRPSGSSSPRADVTVVGYLRAASGVGEVGRQTLHTLAAGGLSVEGLDVALGVVSARDDASVADWLVERGSAGVQVFNINADQIPPVVAHTRATLRPDAVRINIPFWELGRIPDVWIPSLASMDEIWAPSRFIQTALAARLDRPVLYMPVAIEITAPPPLPRGKFALPDDRFLFFYAFDFLSFMERKNPRGVIAAFRQAFPTRGRAGMVLKCMNGAAAPDQFTAFQKAIDGDPDIFLIDQTLTRADTLGLIAATDAVISLHRSEGLGLLIAEAMLLGKPVIATDYSASREFVTAATGYPVGYQLIPLREGDYPYPENQVWADPDISHAAWHMRRLAADPESAAEKRRLARAHLERNYSRSAVAQLQTRRLHRLLNGEFGAT